MARWWLPSLLVIDRTRAMSFMTLAVWSQPSAIEMPGTAVAMALVSPPWSVPGLGSNVSSWLGPPAIQSRMHAICRLRRSSAWSGHPIGEADGNRRPRAASARGPQADRLEEMPAADHARAAHRHLHRFFFESHGLSLTGSSDCDPVF